MPSAVGEEAADCLFGGAGQEMTAMGHRLFQRNRPGAKAEHGVDADAMEIPEVFSDASGDGEARDVAGPGTGSDPGRRLAERRLEINLTFAGEDQVGLFEPLVEADEIEHQIDPPAQFGAEKGAEAGAEPARGAGAREVAHVDAEIGLDDRGEIGQTGVQCFDLRGRRPFLRTIDVRGTLWAEQGIADPNP